MAPYTVFLAPKKRSSERTVEGTVGNDAVSHHGSHHLWPRIAVRSARQRLKAQRLVCSLLVFQFFHWHRRSVETWKPRVGLVRHSIDIVISCSFSVKFQGVRKLFHSKTQPLLLWDKKNVVEQCRTRCSRCYFISNICIIHICSIFCSLWIFTGLPFKAEPGRRARGRSRHGVGFSPDVNWRRSAHNKASCFTIPLLIPSQSGIELT